MQHHGRSRYNIIKNSTLMAFKKIIKKQKDCEKISSKRTEESINDEGKQWSWWEMVEETMKITALCT